MSPGLDGLTPCVHCGFCLQACPTFLATGDEADGPRGRILLMQHLERGDIEPSDTGATRHLDRCLGCRACEPVCPSGVTYGPALEATRHRLVQERGVPVMTRIVLTALTDPLWSRPTYFAARLLRPVARLLPLTGRLGMPLGMLAATKGREDGKAGRREDGKMELDAGGDGGGHPAIPPSRHSALFLGCVQRALFDHVHAATRRTLAANGIGILDVPDQGCCGALHAHAGLREDAVRLATANLEAFSVTDDDIPIVVNAAGCGAMLRSYGELLHDTPLRDAARRVAARVRDVSEVLAGAGPRQGAPLALRVAYDPPCHLAHAQRVIDPPRAVLAAIPELEIVAHEEPDLCCGSAGLYSLAQPELAHVTLRRKLDCLETAAPDVVVTGNPGCIMFLGAGLRQRRSGIPVLHPVELLDRAYALAGYYQDDA